MIATSKDVRSWAVGLGIGTSPRGPVPKWVWDAYLETHPQASN